MKKLVSIIICFMLVFGVFSCIQQSAFAQTQESGIYTYTVKNGEATIVNVDEFARGDITIPSELGGYPVTKIGSYAFSMSLFTSIVVPNSVTTIGDYAFDYSDIVSIKLSENITKIKENTFEGCEYLKSIDIPKNVTKISKNAFDGCESLQEITIPKNVEKIGFRALSYCYSLKSINVDKDNEFSTIKKLFFK